MCGRVNDCLGERSHRARKAQALESDGKGRGGSQWGEDRVSKVQERGRGVAPYQEIRRLCRSARSRSIGTWLTDHG